jgi:hypothetical protein
MNEEPKGLIDTSSSWSGEADLQPTWRGGIILKQKWPQFIEYDVFISCRSVSRRGSIPYQPWDLALEGFEIVVKEMRTNMK